MKTGHLLLVLETENEQSNDVGCCMVVWWCDGVRLVSPRVTMLGPVASVVTTG